MRSRFHGKVSPETAAIRFLARHEASAVPVNVYRLAKAEGISVFDDSELGPDVSGMLIRDDRHEHGPIIIVRKRDAAARKRFTIAHELGHYLLHEGRPLLLDTSAPRFRLHERRTGGEVPSPREESQANRFAAELLMPEKAVVERFDYLASRSQLTEPELIHDLATEFEVSEAAIMYRLTNVGLIVASFDDVRKPKRLHLP